MSLRFCVAALTIERRFAEQIGRNPAAAPAARPDLDLQTMTGCTGGERMPAFQRKFRLLMVEIYHAVAPVMAGSAAFTKILHMLQHKSHILAGMAGGAGRVGGRKVAFYLVAGGAIHGSGVVVHLVPIQAEMGS